MADKPDWLFRQSGVIPILENRIVLITAIKSKRWIIPKGVVDQGLSPQESAAKEAMEEAGIIGKVGSKMIGMYQYDKWGGTCKVKVYPLYVEKLLNHWEEKGVRQRKVVSPAEAVEMVQQKGLRDIMKRFFKKNMPGA